MSDPESDFEDEYPSPQRPQPQSPQRPQPQRPQPQSPQRPQMRVIELQPAENLRQINGVIFYPGQLPIPQTSGESTAEYPLLNDLRYMQNRVYFAEENVKNLERERDNMLSRFYELQDTCKTLREENEALRAQLATLQKTTGSKLRM